MEITCYVCHQEFLNKNNLKRHVLTIHDRPAREVKDFLNDLKDPNQQCECGFVGLKLSRHVKTKLHYKRMRKIEKKRTKAFVVRHEDTDSDSETASDRDSDNSENDCPTEDEFFEQFTQYCKSSGGLLKDKTISSYKNKLLHFVRFRKQKDKNFDIGKTIYVTNKEEFLKVPSVLGFLDKFEGSENKSIAACAYLKMIDFILSVVSQNDHCISEKRSNQITSYLQRRRKEARDQDRMHSKNIPKNREERNRVKENVARTEHDLRIPFEELKILKMVYKDSDYRKDTYTDLHDMRKVMLVDKKMTNLEIRDFLAFEVFFESAGFRPDVVMNLRIVEVINAKELQDIRFQDQRVIFVENHKTSNAYNAAQLQLPLALVQLLVKYINHVRPTLVMNQERGPDEFVFVTNFGKKMQTLIPCMSVFRRVTKCKYKVYPMDFRRETATLTQQSQDPTVRQEMPRFMGHSENTQKKIYVAQIEKAKKHASLKSKLYGMSKDLPVDEDFAAEMIDVRQQVNQQFTENVIREKAKRKSENFVPTPRHKFSPQEVKIMIRAFSSIKDSSGKQKKNINDKDIKRVYIENEDFRKMYREHRHDQEKSEIELNKQLKNSYNFHFVRKLKKKNDKWYVIQVSPSSQR